MANLTDIIARARGLEPAAAPSAAFKLPVPTVIDPCGECGSVALYRAPSDYGWSCLGCRVRVEPPLPPLSEQTRDGWQVVS